MNSGTLLLRQINPFWLQNGRVTSQAFRPTPKDEKLLSVYDGDLISPQNAWQHFTASGYPSVGVMAVTVGECLQLDLPSRSDSRPFAEHAVIDYSAFGTSLIEKKAKLLRVKAEQRNWLFQATA